MFPFIRRYRKKYLAHSINSSLSLYFYPMKTLTLAFALKNEKFFGSYLCFKKLREFVISINKLAENYGLEFFNGSKDTLAIPLYYELKDELISKPYITPFPSRCEIARCALRRGLIEDKKISNLLDFETDLEVESLIKKFKFKNLSHSLFELGYLF